jgi:elongation factor P
VTAIPYIQVRKGMVIIEDGQLQYVVERDLNTPGNWRAILHLKLKNLATGAIANKRVHPDGKVEQAFLDRRDMQYIYQDGDGYVFMDTETYDQITLTHEWVGEQMLYMKEGFQATVMLHDGKPISLELPPHVELAVAETEPSLRVGGPTGQRKSATLETGLQVGVPAFVEAGEVLLVDTQTGECLSRVK